MRMIKNCIIFIICLCLSRLCAQTYNNIRVAYIHGGYGGSGSDSRIPTGFYKRAQANGFNYVLVEYSLDSSMWSNGKYIDTLGKTGLQKGLEDEFIAANKYGLKLIPLFQTSNIHAGQWGQVKNPNIQWQMLPSNIDTTIHNQFDNKIPSFAPDPSGFDNSFNQLLYVIYRAFNKAKARKTPDSLTYKNLDYIHFGADESIAQFSINGIRKTVVMAGLCQRDRDWLISKGYGKGTNATPQSRIIALLGSNIKNKVNMIKAAGIKYGHNTQALYYGDMLDPNHLGGTDSLYSFFDLFSTSSDNTTKIKTYGLASNRYVNEIKNSSIVVQWNYDQKNGYSEKNDYDTDSTFRYFTHNGLRFLHGNEITHADNPIGGSRLHQLVEQAVVGADPKFNNYARGFVSFHWCPYAENRLAYKTMEFLSHILWYNAALLE